MTAAQHLLTWLTPQRREMLNALAIDRYAERPLGTFSRFLKGQRFMTLERAGVAPYYPVLALFGYRPDLDLVHDEVVKAGWSGNYPF